MKRFLNCFSTDMITIFFLIFTPSLINASDENEVKEIKGRLIELVEFDYNFNEYGLEHQFVIEDTVLRAECHPSPVLIKSNLKFKCAYKKVKTFFYKSDADKNVQWRIQLDEHIQRDSGEKLLSENKKIVINRENKVYLIVERQTQLENLDEIYTPENREGITVLKKVSTFKNYNAFPERHIFIESDKLIIFDKLNVRVVEIKSGKQMPIAALDSNYQVVQDMKDDIYFTTATCSISNASFSVNYIDLVVLTKNGNYKPIKIEGIIEKSTERLFEIKVGRQNELCIGILDFSSIIPRLKIKNLAEGKLTTIFSESSFSGMSQYSTIMEHCCTHSHLRRSVEYEYSYCYELPRTYTPQYTYVLTPKILLLYLVLFFSFYIFFAFIGDVFAFLETFFEFHDQNLGFMPLKDYIKLLN